MSILREQVACDLCAGREFTALWEASDRLTKTGERFTLVQCRNCSLVFVNPRPKEAEMHHFYEKEYPSFQPSRGLGRLLKKVFLKKEIRLLRRFLPKEGSILEVGTGVAEDLALIRDSGHWKVQGIDTSDHAVREARHHFNVSVFHGTLFDAAYADRTFDYIRIKYVLSHVHSPKKLLSEVARILKPGGIVILWVPNFDSWGRMLFGKRWEGGEMPRHLYDFTPEIVRSYAANVGFSVERSMQSVVPNTHIHSFRNFLEDKGFRMSARLFSLNIVTLLVFFPVSFCAALFGKSDRITVVLKK